MGYDHLGANCTLVEYDKQSYKNASALFEKHAKNKFEIINADLFDFKFPKESFDFVLSMGVAHHTKDPIRNIELCCQALKPGGMFIFGIGNKAGFFQRNLQRLIVYSISENNEEAFKNACDNDLSKIKTCVKLTGYVNSTEDFIEQPKVINGASDLIASIFGEAGMHTRAAVSTNSLPLGVSVEVDAIFELK